MSLPCDKSEVIHYIKDSVDKLDQKIDKNNLLINAKLDSVVDFKNKALGIILATTTIISGVFNLVSLLLVFIFKK